jgi:hypothetical protein
MLNTFNDCLTLLIEILGQVDVYKKINKHVQVFDIEQSKLCIPWTDDRVHDLDLFIYYGYNARKPNDDETHFRVACRTKIVTRGRIHRKWELIDPYHLYQKMGSHGFCQMFAHFIAHNDVDDFADISKAHDVSNLKEIFTTNTFICLQKTLCLIKTNNRIYNLMSGVFEEIKQNEFERRDFGIHKKTNFGGFINRLSLFELDDIQSYIDGLYT